MPDNTESQSIQHIKNITEQNINHLIQSDSDIKGIVNIEARNDGKYNAVVHRGTEKKARRIEELDKEQLIEIMEQQL